MIHSLMKGYLHSFESLAAVDGRGIRCAVFLAGCPLRCVCCHNPDTWDMRNATETTPEELVRKIARYKPYFREDGGVTFSGGEPLLQAAFIEEMLPLLAERKIPYAVDTSGAVKLTDTVKNVLTHAQTVLLDLKYPNDALYLAYTGCDMQLPYEVLQYLESIQKETWLRTVVIPAINDTEDALEAYLQRMKDFSCVKKYELLAFHTMGFYKYRELGIANPLEQTPALAPERLNALQQFVDNRLAQIKKA